MSCTKCPCHLSCRCTCHSRKRRKSDGTTGQFAPERSGAKYFRYNVPCPFCARSVTRLAEHITACHSKHIQPALLSKAKIDARNWADSKLDTLGRNVYVPSLLVEELKAMENDELQHQLESWGHVIVAEGGLVENEVICKYCHKRMKRTAEAKCTDTQSRESTTVEIVSQRQSELSDIELFDSDTDFNPSRRARSQGIFTDFPRPGQEYLKVSEAATFPGANMLRAFVDYLRKGGVAESTVQNYYRIQRQMFLRLLKKKRLKQMRLIPLSIGTILNIGILKFVDIIEQADVAPQTRCVWAQALRKFSEFMSNHSSMLDDYSLKVMAQTFAANATKLVTSLTHARDRQPPKVPVRSDLFQDVKNRLESNEHRVAIANVAQHASTRNYIVNQQDYETILNYCVGSFCVHCVQRPEAAKNLTLGEYESSEIVGNEIIIELHEHKTKKYSPVHTIHVPIALRRYLVLFAQMRKYRAEQLNWDSSDARESFFRSWNWKSINPTTLLKEYLGFRYGEHSTAIRKAAATFTAEHQPHLQYSVSTQLSHSLRTHRAKYVQPSQKSGVAGAEFLAGVQPTIREASTVASTIVTPMKRRIVTLCKTGVPVKLETRITDDSDVSSGKVFGTDLGTPQKVAKKRTRKTYQLTPDQRLEALKRQCIEQSFDSCEVRDSPGKGRGVFATKACHKGQLLCNYPGPQWLRTVYLDNRSQMTHVDQRRSETYAFDVTMNGKELTIAPDADEDGFGHLINHSLCPNTIGRVNHKAKELLFYASENIAVGQELFHNYGVHYKDECFYKYCFKNCSKHKQ